MLSDRSIIDAHNAGHIYISPPPESLGLEVQPASVDVHLGDNLLFFRDVPEIDPRREQRELTYWQPIAEGGVLILPNEFLLGTTHETLRVNGNFSAEITGKSSLGRLGLLVHSTAGFIDPGFNGRITLEIKNLNRNPIRLYAGMKIAQFKFFRLDAPCERPYGSPGLGSHYQHQSDVTASRSWESR